MTRKAPSALTRWLRSLDAERLTALLTARPDATAAPQPRTLGELSQRLNSDHSVRLALHRVPVPGIQLLEVLQALGDRSSRAALDRLLGVGAHVDAGALDELLGLLASLALAWTDGGELRLAAALTRFTTDPLGLGAPAATLLGALSVEQLRRIAAEHALSAQPRKAEWVRALAELLADSRRVRATLAAAPADARRAAELLAWEGPRVRAPVEAALYRFPGYGLDAATRWLALHGYLLPSGEWGEAQLPREVALAIRGEDYRPELSLAAPQLATRVLVGEPQPDAAGSLVDGVQRLLRSDRPLQTLAAGGVGVRELRRMAKELHSTEGEVRLWLELAVAAGIARSHDGEVLPTAAADDWLAASPAGQLVTLLTAWSELGPVPSHRVDPDGKTLPALGLGGSAAIGPPLREDLLGALAELPPGTAVSDMDSLIDVMAWRHPLRYRDAETLGPYLVATWTEAQRLGVIADGALTALGAALSAGSAAELAALAERAVPARVAHATFLPDLTAVVAGPPSAGLAELLDTVADQQSADTASTWRLSPSSVRRALDAGQTADALLARLAEAADRALPQPLEYLITDTARRHGQVRVRSAACCVCTDEPGLAAEIVRHRRLAKLGLRQLSATVLASAEPVKRTLQLLREAGYAPVQQASSGDTVIERVAPRRAPEPRRHASPAGAGPSPPLPPAELATRLVAAPTAELQPVPLSDCEQLVAAGTARLDEAQARLLSYALERRTPVRIEYVSSSGGHTDRVVEPLDLIFDTLQAWCRLRHDERFFRLDRIRSVSPA